MINYNGTNLTLIQLVGVFQEISRKHGQINSFSHGELYDFNATTVTNYPTMFLQVEPSKINVNTIDYSITVLVADLVDPDISNYLEVESDTFRILYDIVYILRDQYDLEPTIAISPKPLIEFKDDRVYGWSAVFTIRTPQIFGWCDAPTK